MGPKFQHTGHMDWHRLYEDDNQGEIMLQFQTPIISVEWDEGHNNESGFGSREKAERFIKRICQKTAPDKDYDIDAIASILPGRFEAAPLKQRF